jgi:signal transduction histidine kinase
MAASSPNSTGSRVSASTFANSAGVFALLGGAATLVGWLAGIPRLTDWNDEGIAMFAIPAVCACLCGLALLILARESPARDRMAGTLRFLGGVVAGVGGLTLFEHATGVNLGIDTLLVHGTWGQEAAVAPMRMGPPASASFTLLGIGIVLAASRSGRVRGAASACGVMTLGIASLALIGYAYGARPLFSAPHLTAIAMQMALILAVLGAGLICAIRERGLTAMLLRRDAGGELVRRLSPALIVFPLALGALRVAGERAGLYESAFGSAARTWVEIAVLLGLLFWTARSSSRIDARRKEAEISRDLLLESERLARAQAEEASRVKDEFLATLSHELRTPLNAILGWSQLVAAHPSDDHVGQAIPAIMRNARAQADLISDLLDMSRITSGKLRLSVERVDLGEVISAALETVRPAAEAKGIRLEAQAPPLSDVICGDAGRLRQVVWNLLSNAVKFTPSGGSVQVSLIRKSSGVEILVSDTGAGLSPDFLPHLFQRFRQKDTSTTRQHGGMGIGLAIVKQLVELHGGSVGATSAGEGYGTTFSVSLPFAARLPTVEAPSAAPEQEDGTELRGMKILAVDDQLDTRQLFERVLKERHAHVVTAASADEALRVLRAEPIDLVLCDLGMPVQDGISFIRQARAEGHTTPALAVTAFARAEDRDRALSAGFQGHVAKPVDIAALIASIAGFAPTRS